MRDDDRELDQPHPSSPSLSSRASSNAAPTRNLFSTESQSNHRTSNEIPHQVQDDDGESGTPQTLHTFSPRRHPGQAATLRRPGISSAPRAKATTKHPARSRIRCGMTILGWTNRTLVLPSNTPHILPLTIIPGKQQRCADPGSLQHREPKQPPNIQRDPASSAG